MMWIYSFNPWLGQSESSLHINGLMSNLRYIASYMKQKCSALSLQLWHHVTWRLQVHKVWIWPPPVWCHLPHLICNQWAANPQKAAIWSQAFLATSHTPSFWILITEPDDHEDVCWNFLNQDVNFKKRFCYLFQHMNYQSYW